MRPIARGGSALATGLAYAVLCLSVLAVAAIVLAPRVSGIHIATVLSDSMRPEMSKGDLLIVRSVDPARIEVGDVILFRSPGDPNVRVAHRVVEVVGDSTPSFVTKGDANEVEDRTPVPADRILGKVQYGLPLVGHVADKMREPLILLLVLAVPGAFIIGGESWNIVREVRRGRPKGSPSLAGVAMGGISEVADVPPPPTERIPIVVQLEVPPLDEVVRQMKKPPFLFALAVPLSFIVASEAWSIARAVRRDKSREPSAEPGREP